MKIPFISSFLPFLNTEAPQTAPPKGNNAQTPSFNPLYRWDRGRPTGSTRFFSATAHSQYVTSLGHPWCFEGFGDAFSMAVVQLLKSEVSIMLSNTAAGLDKNRSELLWDTDQKSFIVANKQKGAVLPGRPANKTTAANITYPVDLPENAVTWPILMGIFSKIFDNSRVGQKLRSVTDMLCQLSDAEAAAQVWPDNVYFCFIEDLVGAMLICGESEQDINCRETMAAYEHSEEDFPDAECHVDDKSLYASLIGDRFKFSDTDLALPVLFVDLLHNGQLIPSRIPPEVVKQEALTYLMLYRSLMIASSFSRKPFLCGADEINPPILIPGWKLPLVLTLREEGDPIFKERGLKRDSMPLVFISQNEDAPCSFVIGIRGTASMFEWAQDFEYWQAPFTLNPNILAHKGFTTILNVIAPLLEDHIRAETERNQCACRDTHLIFTGHSLGAGVGQMLALHFAEKFGRHQCGADIAGAFFAPPRMFNKAGAERFREIVNGRTLLDIGDGLSYMPCFDGNAKSGWARCSRGHMTSPGVGRDLYADNYGLVEIEVDYVERDGGKEVDAIMQTIFPSRDRTKSSTLGSLFSRLVKLGIPVLNRVPSLGVLGATHVCSFACKFSQQACGYHFQWWCNGCPLLL